MSPYSGSAGSLSHPGTGVLLVELLLARGLLGGACCSNEHLHEHFVYTSTWLLPSYRITSFERVADQDHQQASSCCDCEYHKIQHGQRLVLCPRPRDNKWAWYYVYFVLDFVMAADLLKDLPCRDRAHFSQYSQGSFKVRPRMVCKGRVMY